MKARTRAEDLKDIDISTVLGTLLAHDDWLPEEFSAPARESYRQYLLYCDPLERFSVVSFVWMPGHRTPIHNHTVWGLVGVLRGEEQCDEFSTGIEKTNTHKVRKGEIDRVSPRIGDNAIDVPSLIIPAPPSDQHGNLTLFD